MPHYDYECNDCQHKFEVYLGVCELDEIIPKCPKCKSESKRLVSGGTGIVFKGGGWAADGYSDSGIAEVKEKEKK